MAIKVPLLKLFIFVLITGAIASLLVARHQRFKEQSAIYTFFKNADQTNDTSYYFIGSSRVQQSVNPEILRKELKNDHIYNAAFQASTFMSNFIIAKRLMRNKTPKTLFFELSPLVLSMPQYILKYRDQLDLEVFSTSSLLPKKQTALSKGTFLLKLCNQYLTNKLFIIDEVRSLAGINVEQNEAQFGFRAESANNFHFISPFLKYEDLSTFTYTNDIREYENYIEYLLDLGKKSNTRIVFFLPITFRKESEKAIIIPLYNKLPAHLKLPVSRNFIKSISQPEYLYDMNHLNKFGAEKYSQLLVEQLLPYIHSKQKVSNVEK